MAVLRYMSEKDKDSRIKALEDRVQTLEEQMTTCLAWMSRQAEEEAAKLDPTFRPTLSARN